MEGRHLPLRARQTEAALPEVNWICGECPVSLGSRPVVGERARDAEVYSDGECNEDVGPHSASNQNVTYGSRGRSIWSLLRCECAPQRHSHPNPGPIASRQCLRSIESNRLDRVRREQRQRSSKAISRPAL